MTSGPEHLIAVETGRGFKIMPALRLLSGSLALAELLGARRMPAGSVGLREASHADEATIWLTVEEDGLVRQDGQTVEVTVPLSAERAWQLKEQIEWLLAHHYHGDQTPNRPQEEPK